MTRIGARRAQHLGPSDRPRSHRVDEAASQLTIAAFEPRLSTGDRRRADRRIVALAPPGAEVRDRALVTARGALGAHERSELHDRLVPTPHLDALDELVGARLRLLAGEGSPRPAGEDPTDVGVDDRGGRLEREGSHGTRRVRPDAGQRQQVVEPLGHPTTVPLDHLRGSSMQVERPPVVAEAGPLLDDTPGRRRCARFGRGEPLEETWETIDDPRDLGLLQHRL